METTTIECRTCQAPDDVLIETDDGTVFAIDLTRAQVESLPEDATASCITCGTTDRLAAFTPLDAYDFRDRVAA